ncbi:MAG: DsbA family protein [Kiloniellales bacterium]|nr:DsbA family protein [Kiloniellales bacterium]
MERRHILISGTALAVLAAGGGLGLLWRDGQAEDALVADEKGVFAGDRILGDPKAPVTIIEYSSLTCPHCAAFHAETLPTIKKNWIEAGKARLVYRHFPFDALGTYAALAANCVEGDRHFAFIDILFRNQARWTRAQDPRAALSQMAAMAGIDKASLDACVQDEAALAKIQKLRKYGSEEYGINSTPSFIINGKKLVGNQGLEKFEQALKDAGSQS